MRAIFDVACATGLRDVTAAQGLEALGDRVCAMRYALRVPWVVAADGRGGIEAGAG